MKLTPEQKRLFLYGVAFVAVVGPAAALAGVSAQGVSAQGVSAQGVSAQGVSAQGVSAQGVSAQGVSAQGVSAQGVSAQGVSAQGVSAQGVSAQGVSAQGVSAQGVSAQGVSAQGVSAQGASLMGNDLLANDFDGVSMTTVDIRGTKAVSDKEDHTLTRVPTMSTGNGNYIALASGSAAGHYAVAHFVNAAGTKAQDLDLFIAAEQPDPMPNLFHNFAEQDNRDELYIVYYFYKWSGEWISLCPYNPLTKSASAVAIAEDPSKPNDFFLACTATGVASKCARNWGYRPWAQTTSYVFDKDAFGGAGGWLPKTFDLKPYYDSCKVAAMAAYCQSGQSFTKTGTQVDLFDTQQIVWPNTIENPWNAANPESLWMNAQEFFIAQSNLSAPFDTALHQSALQRSRYRELSPITECDDFAAVDRLEHDHIEDGRWGALFEDVGTINVFSPNYCTHDEYTPGDALPWDCSPCTTKVCQTHPECCGSAGVPGAWDLATCIPQANAVCNDAGGQWAPGKVWPKNVSNDDQSIYPTYLLGPTGAVLRADGVSGSGTSATISGWACDPEWAGASVAVQIYAGGTADGGGTLLGEVRADQALTTPLATEVSAACDGPGRTFARHGFSFTLPNNQTGNVWVYVKDESTANGPAAPATLLRNGVVQVPRCAHSEHVSGDALSASCSTCAGSVCGDGSHDSCCTTAWTDDCAAAADSCAPADTSVPFNSRSFAAVTTGWIEAPTTGTYTFQASQLPSRLFVNGATVLDWFTTSPGTTSGTIDLRGGHRYNIRWDRLQAEPPSGTPGAGLTWQPPGAVGQTDIPPTSLYAIAPGGTTGLSVTYFTGANPNGFTGATTTRVDGNIDINKDVAPPGPTPLDLPAGYGPSYSAIWDGEIVPSFSESYNFYVVGSGEAHLYLNGAEVSFPGPPPSSAPGGCAHDLCQLGDKLDASCNSCVHDICEADPYCCDGGYLSYYSIQPVWDARCMAEVATYCGPSHCNAPDPQAPLSPEKKSSAVPLQAGVHYAIRLTYDNPSTDKTIRLLWVSTRQAKQAVGQYALLPPGPPGNAGSGLNVTYFATKSQNGTVKADGTAVATGMVADLSLTPALGALGLPVVNVFATPVDASSGRPSPPSVTRPRYGEEVFITAGGSVHVTGIGGIGSGAVRISGGLGGVVIAPVSPNGDFEADVPVATGPLTLKLVQQTYTTAPPCLGPGLCADSSDLTWPITVTVKTASPKAPKILSPTDPTHSSVAAPLVLNVVGTGSSGPVHVTDLGMEPTLGIPDIAGDPSGTFSGQITLDNGDTTDPNRGFHKIVFDQGGDKSPPVFVSVGIDPPTVVFPRNGAELDCTQDPDPPTTMQAIGVLPYPENVFGRLRVMEETGVEALAPVGAETVFPQVPPGSPIVFRTLFNPGPGRHVVLFFQAPDPPADPKAAAEHFRGYSRLADTPFSRVVFEVKPPRIVIPGGAAQQLRPQQPFAIGNLTDCVPFQSPPASRCALPLSDVNVRVGTRLYTTRADAKGQWRIQIFDLPQHGWSDVTVSQVADSRVGGAWSESCPSNTLEVGYESLDGTVIDVPPDIQVNATGPAGAVVFYPDVKARAQDNTPLPVECAPKSGDTFPIGTTFVHCAASNPASGQVTLNGFRVTVIDTPPTIQVSDVVAEADQSAGKELDSYPVLASDVVDGTHLDVECLPPAPNLFLLDEVTPVVCTATDHTGQFATGQFTVKVVDTTPPTMCPLSDIMIGTNAGAGAIVNYATCANDIVDGDMIPDCDHPSGSFFPFGNTLVKCTATDKHGNSSSETFTVSVGDTIPPVLELPTTVTAFATSKLGARVNYTVTATDNVDPNPTVKCKPPSGSQFPIGKSTVTCTATDSSGNKSQGTFIVKVIIAWSDLLPPIPTDGTGVFQRGSTIPVKFTLVPPSDGICDLVAHLYVAPLDAAGNPGPEKPAKGHGVSSGNVFAATGNHYQLNMDTGPMAVGRWQLRVDLGDGEIHTTPITLR